MIRRRNRNRRGVTISVNTNGPLPNGRGANSNNNSPPNNNQGGSRRNRRRNNNRRRSNYQQIAGVATPNFSSSMNPDSPVEVGSGSNVVMIDRETIRISHSYLFVEVQDSNNKGSVVLRPNYDDTQFREFVKHYTKFRLRGLKATWQPAVSAYTNGVIGFGITTAPLIIKNPTLPDITALPGASLGQIYRSQTSVLDTRGFGVSWFNATPTATDGFPTLTWNSVTTPGTLERGYFLISYVAEYAAPIYSNVMKSDLTPQLNPISALDRDNAIADLTGAVAALIRRVDDLSLTRSNPNEVTHRV